LKVIDTPFTQERERQLDFDTFNMALCNAAVLALLDPKANNCLHIDASQYALGTAFSQMQDKAE